LRCGTNRARRRWTLALSSTKLLCATGSWHGAATRRATRPPAPARRASGSPDAVERGARLVTTLCWPRRLDGRAVSIRERSSPVACVRRTHAPSMVITGADIAVTARDIRIRNTEIRPHGPMPWLTTPSTGSVPRAHHDGHRQNGQCEDRTSPTGDPTSGTVHRAVNYVFGAQARSEAVLRTKTNEPGPGLRTIEAADFDAPHG